MQLKDDGIMGQLVNHKSNVYVKAADVQNYTLSQREIYLQVKYITAL